MLDTVDFQSAQNFINYTDHAYSRMCNRFVNEKDILLCLRFGEVFYKTGIKFHVISKKVISKHKLSSDLDGLCVLVSPNNRIITTYKNKEAISQIKRLSKSNLKKTISFDA